jgi:hypothetical protein
MTSVWKGVQSPMLLDPTCAVLKPDEPLREPHLLSLVFLWLLLGHCCILLGWVTPQEEEVLASGAAAGCTGAKDFWRLISASASACAQRGSGCTCGRWDTQA